MDTITKYLKRGIGSSNLYLKIFFIMLSIKSFFLKIEMIIFIENSDILSIYRITSLQQFLRELTVCLQLKSKVRLLNTFFK